jgi:hypothetical protein
MSPLRRLFLSTVQYAYWKFGADETDPAMKRVFEALSDTAQEELKRRLAAFKGSSSNEVH